MTKKNEPKVVDGWTFTTNFFTEMWERDLREWNNCYGTEIATYKVRLLEKGDQKLYVVYCNGEAVIAQGTMEEMDLFIAFYKQDKNEEIDIVSMADKDEK